MTLKSINGCLVSVDGQLEPCDCECDICTTGNLCQYFTDMNEWQARNFNFPPGLLEELSQIPFNSSFGPYQLLGKYFDVKFTIDRHLSQTIEYTYSNNPNYNSLYTNLDSWTGSATVRFRMARSGLSQAELSALFGPPFSGEWLRYLTFDACDTRRGGTLYRDVSSNTLERRWIQTRNGDVTDDVTVPVSNPMNVIGAYLSTPYQINYYGDVLPGVPADGFLFFPFPEPLSTFLAYYPGRLPSGTYFEEDERTGWPLTGATTPEERLEALRFFRTGGQAEGEAFSVDEYSTESFRTQSSLAVSRGPISTQTVTRSSAYDETRFGEVTDIDWTETWNVTIEFETVLDCPPGSPVWGLPAIDCLSPPIYKVAFDCANQFLITYDPSDTPGTQGVDWVTIEFEGRRYVPTDFSSSQEPPPGLVFSLDTCRETVLGYPCAVGQSDPYPVDVADIPAGALTFRVGEVIYRLTGDVTGLIGRPVDEWLFEPCPEFEWEIVERCNPNGIPGYPDVARAPILDDVGTRCVIVEPRPDLGPGCLVIIEYRRTGEPTNDLDLPVISFSSQDNACRPDTLRCDGQGGGPPSDICQYCLGLPPAVRPPWCADVIQDCLSFRGFQDPGVARAIQRQARAAGCRGCGDPGVDAMM
jgi:hypothetical protein